MDAVSLAQSVLGTGLFLLASFTLGQRLVFALIRWTNDKFISEAPVVTAILIVMGVMALITYLLGIQTVLGAFVAGILVGQSPILTRHINEQLRGLVVALFMPVFFALAGLHADLSILKYPQLAILTVGLIAIASVGKFTGAFLGGALARLSGRESLALACGMNARGSTEVIVASIGLSMGVISQDLFTMIVTAAARCRRRQRKREACLASGRPDRCVTGNHNHCSPSGWRKCCRGESRYRDNRRVGNR
jgi:Kef-type K+ transport system membrane component KefB